MRAALKDKEDPDILYSVAGIRMAYYIEDSYSAPIYMAVFPSSGLSVYVN